MPSFLACARRYRLSKEETKAIQAHIKEMGDDALGVQSYLDSLDAEKTGLQQKLADQGEFVSIDDATPPPNAYQDMQATIKSVKEALRQPPVDIVRAVRSIGGIKAGSDAGEIQHTFDTSSFRILRKDGLEPDYMREALVEEGYLPRDATIDDMFIALRKNNDGEKVYSSFDQEWVEAYEAAQLFRDEIEEAGIRWDDLDAEALIRLETNLARNEAATKAKAGEAGRGAKEAGKVEAKAGDRLMRAMDRLQEADERITYLREVAAPKVRQEVADANKQARIARSELKSARKAQDSDNFYANVVDIDEAVENTINTLVGLKPGQHSYHAVMSSPTRARVLDIPDEELLPWLETDVGVMLSQYFHSMVPDIEITRTFGDLELSEVKRKIIDRKDRMIRDLKDQKKIERIENETRQRLKDLDGMRDRIRGVYGVPDDPKDIFVRAGRTARSLSYTGYLGGMTLSALPDVANTIGRNGIEVAFGSIEMITNPKRFGMATKDAMDLGAAAEWWLNSRAVSMADVLDTYGQNSKFERGVGAVTRGFGMATGMTPWNTGWKSAGGALIQSRMAKAAVAWSQGKATKKQVTQLTSAGIEGHMADRIAKQVMEHGDRDGNLWLSHGAKWTDRDAYEAFRGAFNREVDIMIVTPSQDKPLFFSKEGWKLFTQFKTFTFSAHHRILLAGIQKADADVLAQFTTAVVLGGLVSNVKADIGGYSRKEGSAFWEDAIDRSGLAGWLMEAYGATNAITGGALSVSGEVPSRFASRSAMQGLLGPTVDMGVGFFGEAIPAMMRGEATNRDGKKLLRPIPGNNLPYIAGLTQKVADAIAELR